MDISHSVFNSVYDTRSGFSIKRLKYKEITSFHQVTTLASSCVKENVFRQERDGIAVENCILINILLS